MKAVHTIFLSIFYEEIEKRKKKTTQPSFNSAAIHPLYVIEKLLPYMYMKMYVWKIITIKNGTRFNTNRFYREILKMFL